VDAPEILEEDGGTGGDVVVFVSSTVSLTTLSGGSIRAVRSVLGSPLALESLPGTIGALPMLDTSVTGLVVSFLGGVVLQTVAGLSPVPVAPVVPVAAATAAAPVPDPEAGVGGVGRAAFAGAPVVTSVVVVVVCLPGP
jgi:hypothetical protein